MVRQSLPDWSPDSREVEGDQDDKSQVWKTPSYGKLDLRAYRLPAQVRFNSKRIYSTDEVYVQDLKQITLSTMGMVINFTHKPEVFLGTPRSFNLGLSVNF